MSAKYYSAWLRIEFKNSYPTEALLKRECQAEGKQANKYKLLQHIAINISQKNKQDRTKNESKSKRPPTVTENQLKNQIDGGGSEGVNHYYARHFTLFRVLLCCFVYCLSVGFVYCCLLFVFVYLYDLWWVVIVVVGYWYGLLVLIDFVIYIGVTLVRKKLCYFFISLFCGDRCAALTKTRNYAK